MARTVDRSALGPMERIGRGGFATVYKVRSRRGRPFAYKEFTKPPDPTAVRNLTGLVDFRENLEARRQQLFDDATAWPQELVTSGGRTVGFTMPLVPPEFFVDMVLPSGKRVTDPAKAEWLIVSTDRAAEASVVVPAADAIPDRVILCAKLSYVLGLLHRDGLVYGDLSQGNVLFSAASPPRIMVVDCDDATTTPDLVTQPNSPDWFPPEIVAGTQKHQDLETDRYKLGLFVLRCLTPGDGASMATDPERVADVLDAEGLGLMRRAVGADRSRRPEAKEWYRYLSTFLEVLTSPPDIADIAVDRVVVEEGETVTVQWSARGGTSAVLSLADGTRLDVDPTGGRRTVPVSRAGAVVLTVTNTFGDAEAATDPVHVHEPAKIEYLRVPEPSLPTLDTRGLQDLVDVLRRMTAGPAGPVVKLPGFPAAVADMPAPALQPAGVSVRPPGDPSFAALLASVERDATVVLEAAADRSRAAARRHLTSH